MKFIQIFGKLIDLDKIIFIEKKDNDKLIFTATNRHRIEIKVKDKEQQEETFDFLDENLNNRFVIREKSRIKN